MVDDVHVQVEGHDECLAVGDVAAYPRALEVGRLDAAAISSWVISICSFGPIVP
ncbi:MAG: hypothetical protein ACRDYE_04895 [Acidimicrobiales bacterium]